MARHGVVRLIDEQRWLDPVSDTLQKAVTQAYASGGTAGQQVKNLLSGTWLGHPLHPLLTDVPIGAWTVALACDALEVGSQRAVFAPGADAAVALGLGGALGAALSGLSDWHFTLDRPRRLGLAHGLLNLSATGLYGASLVARLRGARGCGRSLALIGYAVTTVAAYLGGELVYGERLGVDHAPQGAPGDFRPVFDEAELREGQPRKVEVNGVAVLVVRQGKQIHALGETCSHLGGPLSEGAIGEGTVTCPWHASQFALADGRVVNGPATFSQPCYQTRVRNGKIEVGPPRIAGEPERTPAGRQPEAAARRGVALAGLPG
jgi:nitrite reductase/ring-hydroxylating ferredoxin subunit/uncharacterized membrane protein